jgi:catalase
MNDERSGTKNSKDKQLETFRVDDKGKTLTTNQGLKVSED